ncbi:DUF4249 domain-containing protein [Spirosoma montaniterrae]|uniref:DUF4249 domain-containing protein n=1 Tax=Spirosoma montaniterrae TaxID=1178516 RepID=A0A1P9WZF7_9BACT|nr:DUF4249 domain-containing protein [Spirosoma montaniterrae]AQG80766.1 hypothetical protein AWR27_16430 [Spirosoma montaniterrae]
MRFNHLIYTIVVGLLLTGCDSLRQEVEPKGLTQEPEKLVVACFISPQDTVLAVRVSRSSPVLGTVNSSQPDIPNATVTLSDGDRSVTLQRAFNQQIGYLYYRATPTQLPIVVGRTYTLTVRVPDGRQVSATCTVPGPVALQSMTLDSAVVNEFGRTRKEYYARLRWRDPAGQVNYYRVAGNNEYVYTSRTGGSPNRPSRDTLIRQTGNWFFDNGSTTTDVGRDGQEFVSGRGRLSVAYIWQNGQQQVSRPTGRVNGYLLNVDENYYRYHDAVERQNRVGENPFAEPVLIPSNIQNGLGCFGAFNKSTLSVELK